MTNNGGGSIECAECPQNLIQSLDGSTCVKCDEACRNCTNTNGFLVEYGQDGNSLRDADGNLMRMCITCNTTNSCKTLTVNIIFISYSKYIFLKSKQAVHVLVVKLICSPKIRQK